MPSLVGTTIGQYDIVEQLGRGGMAAVYKGYQPALKRYVAIKVLDPTVSSDELFLARFQREAQAVALLRHPHIVQIYDSGNVDDMYYMVMEYVDGHSLRDKLKALAARGEFMPVQDVLGVVWAMASALDYAYQRGIIHRDIKPGNILLSSDGQAVLGDFGIAQMIKSSRLTLSGLVGTPNYMSPEQGQGLDIDQRTDIYSLGIVAYEMITNRVPFSSDTPFAVVMAHVTRPLPPLQENRPDIPFTVEDVIIKAAAKDKEQRYYRAMDFAESLEAAFAPMLESGVDSEQDVLSCSHCHFPLDPGQRFCAKCGTHAGSAAAESEPRGPESLDSPARIAGLAKVPVLETTSPSLSLRPDIKDVEYPGLPPESVSPSPALKQPGSPGNAKPRLLLGIAAGVLILLLIVAALMILVFPSQDAKEVIAAQPTATATVSVTADSDAGVEIVDALSPVPDIVSAGDDTAVPPTALPTISEIATIAVSPSASLFSVPTDTPGVVLRLTPTATLYIGAMISSTVTPDPSVVPVSTRLLATPAPETLRGKIVFKTDRDGDTSLYVMNADGSNPHPLTDFETYERAMDGESLSSDGTERLRVQDNAGKYDIYMVPADEHKSPLAITSHAAADYDPTWSPNDEWIAFVSLRTDGKDAIFVMTPDGRNDRQLTFNTGALDKHPSWSPDGNQIAFGSNQDGGLLQVYVINFDGTGQMNLSNNSFNDWDPIWIK